MKIVLGFIEECSFDYSHVINIIENTAAEIVYSVKNTEKEMVSFLKLCHEKYRELKADGIVIVDRQGIFPFMYLAKLSDVIVAEISDEHSAYMTKLHNNANVLVIASQSCGAGVFKMTLETFLSAQYESGRHEVRLDMLKGGK